MSYTQTVSETLGRNLPDGAQTTFPVKMRRLLTNRFELVDSGNRIDYSKSGYKHLDKDLRKYDQKVRFIVMFPESKETIEARPDNGDDEGPTDMDDEIRIILNVRLPVYDTVEDETILESTEVGRLELNIKTLTITTLSMKYRPFDRLNLNEDATYKIRRNLLHKMLLLGLELLDFIPEDVYLRLLDDIPISDRDSIVYDPSIKQIDDEEHPVPPKRYLELLMGEGIEEEGLGFKGQGDDTWKQNLGYLKNRLREVVKEQESGR